MGNKLAFPDRGKCRIKSTLAEFQGITYGQLVDSYAYWRLQAYPQLVERQHFDDVFGNILKDCDELFALFSKGKKYVDSFQVFVLLVLFTRSSLEKKITFIVGIQTEYNLSNIVPANLKTSLTYISTALNICFNTALPQQRDIEYSAEVSFLSFIQRNPSISKRCASNNSNGDVSINIKELMRLCEDIRAVAEYIDSVTKACAKDGDFHSDASKNAHKINEKDITQLFDLKFNQKERLHERFTKACDLSMRSSGPLWNSTIYELLRPFADDSSKWAIDIPKVSDNDFMINVFESIIFSGRNVCQVVAPAARAQDQGKNGNGGGGSKKVEINATTNRELGSNNSSGKGNDKNVNALQGSSDSSLVIGDEVDSTFEQKIKSVIKLPSNVRENSLIEINGVFDCYTLLIWLLDCCPSELYSAANEEFSKMAMIINKLNENGDGKNKYYGKAEISLSGVSQLKQRLKVARKSSSAQFLKKIQTMGESALFTNVATVLQSPRISKRIRYDKSHIFMVDQPIINAIQMIADGFRAVPVALDRKAPFKVDTLITLHDMVSYFRSNAQDYFRYLQKVPVSKIKPRIMRRPVIINHEITSMNFSCALYYLTSRNVDAAMMVDKDGFGAGLFTADKVMVSLYWEWKRMLDMTYKFKTFDEVVGNFIAGKHKVVDVDAMMKRPPQMNFLNVILQSLNTLEQFGVKLDNIKAKLDAAAELYELNLAAEAKKATKRKNDEDNDEDEDEEAELLDQEDIVYSGTDDDEEDEEEEEGDEYEDDDFEGLVGKSKDRTPSTKLSSASIANMVGTGKKSSIVSVAASATAAAAPPTSASGNRESASRKSRGGKGGKGANSRSAAQKALQDKILLEQQKKQLAVQQFKNKLLGDWLVANSCILDSDDIFAAIEVMYICKTTRAFVVTTEGLVVGVVTLRDICIELLRREDELKEMIFDFLRYEEHVSERKFLANLAAMLAINSQ